MYVCIILIMIYSVCSTTLGITSCLLTSNELFFLLSHCQSLLNQRTHNTLFLLGYELSLHAGQVPIFCFKPSCWMHVFTHWDKIWSVVWYSLPNMNFTSSLKWNRCRDAFFFPRPVSTADIFVVRIILDISLFWNVGKIDCLPKIFGLFFLSLPIVPGFFSGSLL